MRPAHNGISNTDRKRMENSSGSTMARSNGSLNDIHQHPVVGLTIPNPQDGDNNSIRSFYGDDDTPLTTPITKRRTSFSLPHLLLNNSEMSSSTPLKHRHDKHGDKYEGRESKGDGSKGEGSKGEGSKGEGLLSSLVSAAHNAAAHFSSGLGSEADKESIKSQDSANVRNEVLAKQREQTLSPAESISFKAMRDSPLATMGKGDLALDHFDDPMDVSTNKLHLGVNDHGLSTILNGKSHREQQQQQQQRPADMRRSNSNLLSTPQGGGPSGRCKSEPNTSETVRSLSPSQPSFYYQNESKRASQTDVSTDASEITTTKSSSSDRQSPKRPNRKKEKEFHQTFKNISPDESLLYDCSCALQKDILVQGRLYISDKHMSFNSNLLGLATHLTIPLAEIVQVEKKATALLFHNGIAVQTLHSKYFFASFFSRDSTFDMLTSAWNEIVHGSSRKIVANGKVLSLPESESESDDTASEPDSDMTSMGSRTSLESSKEIDHEAEKNNENSNSFYGLTLSGPATHPPTEPTYQKKSTDTVVGEGTLKGPIGVIYQLLFGDDTKFLRDMLVKGKNTDISEIPKMSKQNPLSREYKFIKPLNGPIGPKQTNCNVKETIEKLDFDNSILVLQSTNTPDVPNGNSFTVETRFVLSWAEQNACKMVVYTSVVWTGKSWIKGAVEKGTVDGQKEAMSLTFATLEEALEDAKESGGGKKKKSKRKAKKAQTALSPPPQASQENIVTRILKLFDPLFDIVGLPGFLRGPFLAIAVLGVYFLTRSSHKADPVVSRESYLVGPNDHRFSDFYRQNEYQLWDWMDIRNGNPRRKSKSEIKSGYKKQELEEMVKLMEMRLEQLQQQLDDGGVQA